MGKWVAIVLTTVCLSAPTHAEQAKRATNRTIEQLEESAEATGDFKAWKRTLSARERTRVYRKCATDYAYSVGTICGGIGPLAIPPPPSEVMMMQRPRGGSQVDPSPGSPPTETRAQWMKRLTKPQRAYVRSHCKEPGISDLCGGTPLVLSFDARPVTFATTPGTFALRAGDLVATDWPTAATPWLAMDRDGNGAIDSGAELFGSGTVLPSGTTATNGFTALGVLDANGDGMLDAADPAFAALLLWADANGDRRSTVDELSPASTRVASISLAYRVDLRCDARNNCEGERAAMTTRDGSAGAVVDVHLQYLDLLD